MYFSIDQKFKPNLQMLKGFIDKFQVINSRNTYPVYLCGALSATFFLWLLGHKISIIYSYSCYVDNATEIYFYAVLE